MCARDSSVSLRACCLVGLTINRNDEIQGLHELSPSSEQEKIMKERFLYKVTLANVEFSFSFSLASNKQPMLIGDAICRLVFFQFPVLWI